jgi:phosphoserine phosphatase RsbU/P
MACHPSTHRPLWRAAFFVLLLAIGAGVAAAAQTSSAPMPAPVFDATTLQQPTDLSETWLVKAGDDPAWARTDCDDRGWMRVDPRQTLKVYFPHDRPNVVWYRLHVKVAPNQTGLALAEFNLTSAFEIYVNGERVMKAGEVAPYKPTAFGARLLTPIPDAAIRTGSMVIALRLYISGNEWVSAFPGLYPYNLTIGQEAALSNHIWLTTIGDRALTWLYQLGSLALGLIALALFAAERQHREYLWMGLLGLTIAIGAPLSFYELFHNLPAWSAYIDTLVPILTLVFETLMYLAFLRVPVFRWMRTLLVLSAAGVLFGAMEKVRGTGSSISLLAGLLPGLILSAGVIPVLLIVHWRRGNREAGILLIPAVVQSLSVYIGLGLFVVSMVPAWAQASLGFQTAIFSLRAGPFVVSTVDLTGCIFVLTLALIIVLRSTRIARQQAQLETEMAAAREVQQVMLPETIETGSGFQVETAYEPSQQVGGDFFQILPAAEGALLVVIGDVAGKGLPAAMLVSVLVGAIRGVAEYTSEPAELLASLNEQLAGRVGGSFSTALAARIHSDGRVLIANAGHLPPYLDGKEVELPGALPLGVKADAQYETMRVQLAAGARLTFYSDGIVEAQNAEGELFGFERSRELAMQPVAEIVDAARRFGQQDDMTAIAVTRVATTEVDKPVAAAAGRELRTAP